LESDKLISVQTGNRNS